MSLFISEALAEAPGVAQSSSGFGGGGIEGLIFPIGLVVILYFFMIRPQMKRQKEHKTLVNDLAKGDEVQTEGGMMGRITEMGDNFLKVEIAEGVEIKIRRQAVAAVMPKGTLKSM